MYEPVSEGFNIGQNSSLGFSKTMIRTYLLYAVLSLVDGYKESSTVKSLCDHDHCKPLGKLNMHILYVVERMLDALHIYSSSHL